VATCEKQTHAKNLFRPSTKTGRSHQCQYRIPGRREEKDEGKENPKMYGHCFPAQNMLNAKKQRRTPATVAEKGAPGEKKEKKRPSQKKKRRGVVGKQNRNRPGWSMGEKQNWESEAKEIKEGMIDMGSANKRPGRLTFRTGGPGRLDHSDGMLPAGVGGKKASGTKCRGVEKGCHNLVREREAKKNTAGAKRKRGSEKHLTGKNEAKGHADEMVAFRVGQSEKKTASNRKKKTVRRRLKKKNEKKGLRTAWPN